MKLELYDALGQRKNAILPPDYLTGEEVGYTKVTTTWTNLVTVAATDVALTGMTMTITGDGVNETEITAKIHGVNPGTVVGIHNIRLWDGAVNSGTLIDQMTSQNPTSGLTSMPMPSIITRIPPFTGTKTFNLAYYTAAGGTIPAVHAGATYPAEMRAVRLKTAPQFYPPQGMVYNPLVSGAAQMASGAESIITWQATEYDTHLMWTAATPTRVTAKMAGLLRLEGIVDFNNSTVASNQILYGAFKKTTPAGTTTYYHQTVLTAQSIHTGIRNIATFTETIPVNPGDYIEFIAFQYNAAGTVRTFNTGINGFRMRWKWDGPTAVNVWEQTDTGWITIPTLQNTWVPLNEAAYATGYRRKNGIVQLRGLIKGGTASGTILTLPAGFRPASTKYIPTICGLSTTDGPAGVYVDPSGNVGFSFGTTTNWFSLDNIRFIAEQ